MKLENVCDEIVGLVPEYNNTGDGCRIICRTAGDDDLLYSYSESRSVESVKRHLARCNALDLAAQGFILQKKYHRTKPLPFYFSDGRIFVPLKLRQVRIAGDPSYGYIELGIISRIQPADHGCCRIKFINGDLLPVYSHVNTARLAIYFGFEIQKNELTPRLDPDQEAIKAFRTLRGYFTGKIE